MKLRLHLTAATQSDAPTFGDWWYGDDVAKGRTGALAHEGDALSIASKRRDVFPQPVQTRHQVHKPEVALRAAPSARLQEACCKDKTLVTEHAFEPWITLLLSVLMLQLPQGDRRPTLHTVQFSGLEVASPALSSDPCTSYCTEDYQNPTEL